MLYLITVLGGALLIILLNFLLDRVYTLSSFGFLALVTFLAIAAVFVIDGLLAFLIRRLPERWFAPEARLFTVGKREKNLYRKSGINKWKKHVPEWGCFTGFHKDKMESPGDSSYLGRFLLESNYGVAGHVAGAVLGYLILLIPYLRPLTVALPVAIVNMVLSLLPTMILRYNTPSLRNLYRRTRVKEEAREKETVTR